MTNGIRKLSLLLGFARVAIWLVLVLMTIPAVARVSAKKPPPPPPSTGSSFATAYSVPYSTSVAESISQASSGGFVVGGLCSETAGTTPNCNGYATVLSVDSNHPHCIAVGLDEFHVIAGVPPSAGAVN